MNMREQTLSQFLRDLASKSPTPGGGSASALSGAMAAALLEMFCRISADSKKYREVNQEMREAAATASVIRDSLEELTQRDSEVFKRVIASRADPDKYQSSLKEATLVPCEVATLSSEIFAISSRLVLRGKQSARSDAQVAICLARAAVLGAIANMRINIDEIGDESFREEMMNKMNNMLQELERD